jgi:hypothetical protein
MRTASLLLSIAFLLVTGAAHADEEQPEQKSPAATTGFEAGGRTGFLFPTGKLTSAGDDMSSGITGQIPIWADIGYRVTPSLFVGAYGQLGFVLPKNCPSTSSCSGTDLRLGPEILFHGSPGAGTDPWFGAGIGWEILTLTESQGGNSVSATASGIEFMNLQAGIDFRLADHARIGPFASFSMNETTSVSASLGGTSGSSSDFDKSLHFWLGAGLRVAYVP